MLVRGQQRLSHVSTQVGEHAHQSYPNGVIKLPKRFALSTLLVVMVATALLFGAAQWRRQRLIAEVASLRAAGVEGLVVSDDWFWPTASGTAVIRLANDVYFGAPDVKERFTALRDRAVACGAGDVAYEMMVMRYYQVVKTIRTKDLDQAEQWSEHDYAKRFFHPAFDNRQ